MTPERARPDLEETRQALRRHDERVEADEEHEEEEEAAAESDERRSDDSED